MWHLFVVFGEKGSFIFIKKQEMNIDLTAVMQSSNLALGVEPNGAVSC